MNNKYTFCHLHRHCEASVQDGVGRVEDGVKYAHEMGHPAVAITDHGSLISYVRFFNEAQTSGIKHIFGLEAYLCDDLSKKDKDHKEYNHCTILVKNKVGFQNIIKLNNISMRDGFYYKPRIDWNTLFKHKEGLIVLSGCVIGRTCQYILSQRYDDADAWTRVMRSEFGEDYYIELMASDFPEQTTCNKYLLEISRKYKIPGVITGDAHYVHKEDYSAQKAMMLLSQKATIQDLEKQQQASESQEDKDKIWIFGSDQYWMKNEEEMIESWQKWHSEYYPLNEFESHLNESGKIADKVEIVTLDDSFKMPKSDLPEGTDHHGQLTANCWQALVDLGLHEKQEYKDRLDSELYIIHEKGLTDYFLVTADIIGWAKRNDVFVGPGRGSAGGSLVCYLLDITEIDPLEHDLLFERFLDLGRKEMPDIDTDFEIDKRDAVKQYITERYGADYVASISALGTFRAKNIVRDLMRVYNYDFAETNDVAKEIPDSAVFVEGRLEDGGEEYITPRLKTFFEEKPEIKAIASTLFGQIRHVSKHAAGVIITNKPLDECIPTINVGGEIMTAWSEGIYRKELSQLNFLKLDILGLKTLSIIKKACKLIGMNYRDLMKLDINDPSVYSLVSSGNYVVGVFQFDSNTGSWLYDKMKPVKFNDLVALSALDRPGPLDSFMAFEYIERMHEKNKTDYEYSHPVINDVLKETYGVIVFQEQLMNLAKKLSDFTPIEASALRKNLVKIQFSTQAREKAEKDRIKIKADFVDRAVANGANEEEVESLWNNMAKFARYGFNKSHSVGYSYVSFWTMWLKTYYPVQFYTALLTYANEDEMPGILYEMREFGIDLAPPDVNSSDIDFIDNQDHKKVLYGLNKIKFLGTKAQEEIIKNRPFKSFDDLCERIPKNILNKRAKEALIRSGAIDLLEPDRGKLLTQLQKESVSKKLKDTIRDYYYSDTEKQQDQLKYLGVTISSKIKKQVRGYHVERQYKTYLSKKIIETNSDIYSMFEKYSGEFRNPETGMEFERFSGFIREIKRTESRSGKTMLRLELDVHKGRPMRFFIMEWDKLYEPLQKLKVDSPLAIAIIKRKTEKDFPRIVQYKELKI